MKAFLKVAGSTVLAVLIVFTAYVLTRIPSSERAWKEYLARPAVVTIVDAGNRFSFTDVRDWTYDANGPVTTGYISRSYDLDALSGIRFLVEPFPENAAFGHTLLIFDFDGAESIAFSVEAKLEEREEYSPYAGLFNTFELAYTWGTEEDFVTRRSVFLDHDLYIYLLEIEPSVVHEVFKAFVEGTRELSTHPKFYNTFAHNCTNELARLINARHPGSLPWDPSRIFTGTADEYLFERGYIKGDSFEEAKAKALVTR